jgi:hypothetical protein
MIPERLVVLLWRPWLELMRKSGWSAPRLVLVPLCDSEPGVVGVVGLSESAVCGIGVAVWDYRVGACVCSG